jgi:hypothetical protein
MDSFTSTLVLAAVGLAIFLFAGFIGFKIPAAVHAVPAEPTGPVERIALPEGLPPAAQQWLFSDPTGAQAPATLVAWGTGWVSSRMPVIGRLWLPLSWTFFLVPGSSFIILNRISWFRRRFLRGGEGYRGGKGIFIMGKNQMEDPNLDETERALAWFYSLWLAPASLLARPGVILHSVENDCLELEVVQTGKPDIKIQMAFDASGALLQTITSTRQGSRTGKAYPYQATLQRPRELPEIGSIPTLYTANWDGDVYLKLTLAGVHFNQDINEPLQSGVVELVNQMV